MQQQLSLFDTTAPQTQPTKPINKRFAVMKATEDKANERWRAAYEAFILQFAETHQNFSAEEIRLAYSQDSSQPQTHAQQASGGIFQRLVKQGKLKKSGFKISAIFGNNLRTYTKG